MTSSLESPLHLRLEREMATMTQAFQKYFEPLITMNRRISIGGGVLALILIGEGAMSFIKPFA
jgi:hypothetical protein